LIKWRDKLKFGAQSRTDGRECRFATCMSLCASIHTFLRQKLGGSKWLRETLANQS